MTKVKREYYLPGSRYSQNKTTIKALFKKHGLVWKGTMDWPRWTSGAETVTAEFMRENEVTVGAKLKYDGDPLSPFCIEFTKLLEGLGAEYDDAEVVTTEQADAQLEAVVNEKLRLWDRVHKPNVEILRKGSIHNGYKPVPEGFINAAIADWKEKREAEEARLRAELSAPPPPPEPEPQPAVTKDELIAPVKKHRKVRKSESKKGVLETIYKYNKIT